MYVMVIEKMPGVTSPCKKRHASSWLSECAEAAPNETSPNKNAEPTMIRRRRKRSASTPAIGAPAATPRLASVSVNLTRCSLAEKIFLNSGSSGCVV